MGGAMPMEPEKPVQLARGLKEKKPDGKDLKKMEKQGAVMEKRKQRSMA